MSVRASDLGYLARTWIAAHPSLYFPLYRSLRQRRHGLIGETTALTLEGFPRSGNSFALRAFALSNPQVEVAHHTHAAAQVLASARRGLPTVVLLREPTAAVRSFLLLRPGLSAAAAFYSYVAFHRPLPALRDRILVVDFEQVTADFGVVIDRINRRWGTRFRRFEHTPANRDEVFRQMEDDHRSRYGAVRPSHLARPVSDRAAATPFLPDGPWPGRARALYEELRGPADSPR